MRQIKFRVKRKDKIKCYLLGHKTDENYNDCGYLICKWCNSHEYYDYVANDSVKIADSLWYKGGLLFQPYYFIKGIFHRIKFAIYHFKLKHIEKSDLPF